MTGEAKDRIALMNAEADFAFTPSAQFTNGVGVSYAITGRFSSVLTVGKSWVKLATEPGRDRRGREGWTVWIEDDLCWEGGPSAGQLLNADEREAVASCISRALSISYGFVTIRTE